MLRSPSRSAREGICFSCVPVNVPVPVNVSAQRALSVTVTVRTASTVWSIGHSSPCLGSLRVLTTELRNALGKHFVSDLQSSSRNGHVFLALPAVGLGYDVVAPLALAVAAIRKGLPSRSRFPAGLRETHVLAPLFESLISPGHKYLVESRRDQDFVRHVR